MSILLKLLWLVTSIFAVVVLYYVSVWLALYWGIGLSITVRDWWKGFLND